MRHLSALLLLAAAAATATAQGPTRHFTTADGLPVSQVRQLVELPDGRIFAATEGAFCLYNGSEFVEQPCNLDSVCPLPVFGAHSHLWQGDSLLWLKDFYSLYIYDAREGRFRYDYEGRTSQPRIARFMHEQGDSVTRAHVAALGPLRPAFEALTAGTEAEGEWLQAYVRDRQGGQWFGLQAGGIVYARPEAARAKVLQAVEGDALRRVAVADDSTLLLAGWRGIYLFDRRKQQVVRTLAEGIGGCPDVVRDAEGRVWISTLMGLACYEGDVPAFYATANCTGFLHHHMRMALPLADGRLLVCNLNHHLGYFSPESLTFTPLTGKLPELERYRTIVAACPAEDPDKVIVCTQNGLFVLDTRADTIGRLPAADAWTRYSKKYNCILRDHAGRTWIGTQNGLLVMEGERVSRIGKADGLPNTCIQSLTEDSRGRLWVGTASGICRVSLAQEGAHILAFGSSDGIPPGEMEERGACITPGDTLYMVARGRLIVLPTQHMRAKHTDCPARIVGIRRHGNNIDIQFSDLNYAAPEHSRYRYRLRGSDDAWQTAGGGKGTAAARYNALPPGNYTFQVQAAQGDGAWGPTAETRFEVEPPLWLSWWAKALYAMALAALGALGIRRYLGLRTARLERENDERVNHLFELRDEARHQFAQAVDIQPRKIAVGQEEEAFAEALLKAIGANMDNADYTVEQLAADVALGRTNLYRKMQTMLGITPNEFIRGVRLKHAAHLLVTTELSIPDISLAIGINTPRYFSAQFKKMFGCTPSAYRGGRENAGEPHPAPFRTEDGEKNKAESRGFQ